jgi:glycosyltransferase involved in cell wall biosynthesis
MKSLLRPWWEDIRLPRRLATDVIDVLLSPYGIVVKSRVPVVATVHDVVALTHGWTLPWHHRRYWTRIAGRLPLAAHVIASSAATVADIRSRVGVSEDRLTVVPLAPHAAFHPSGPTQVRRLQERLGLRPPYVVVVGSGTGRKGLDTLYTATSRIDGLEVASVSDDPPPSAYPCVHSTGRLSDEDLAALMTGALAVACPSLTEGFGLPVVEAMSCAAPVLASRAGALTEVAGDAAILLPANDIGSWRAALQRLIDEPALAAAMGTLGRARVSDLTWERTALATLDVVRQVVGNR